MKDSVQVNNSAEVKPGVVLTAFEQNPKLIKAFDNKEEALQELRKYKSSVGKYRNTGKLARFNERF